MLRPYAPEVVVLLIGTNDLGGGRPALATAANVRRCTGAIGARVPGVRVLLLALLPRCDGGGARATLVDAVNAYLEAYAVADGTRFANVGATFVTAQGVPRAERYEPDGLHLSAEGYRAFADALAAPLHDALAARA